MLRDIWQRFSEFITPIKGSIMLAVIALISAFVTYFGYDFLKSKLPLGLLVPTTGLIGIFIFLVLSFVFVAIQRIIEGEDIEYPKEIGKGKFDAMYKEDEEVFEVPIFLPIKNRNKYKDFLCYAVLEKFEIVYNEEFELSDEISKSMKTENLIRSKITNLRWKENVYESQNCEMLIPSQQERNIEVARFQFLLKNSFEQNHARARLGIRYCKDEKQHKAQLGLYEVKISINYRKDGGEIRTKYLDGYIYANVFEEFNLEDDIRNRVKGKVVFGSGSWQKNKEIPKPKSR